MKETLDSKDTENWVSFASARIRVPTTRGEPVLPEDGLTRCRLFLSGTCIPCYTNRELAVLSNGGDDASGSLRQARFGLEGFW
jgi:hypothetical protein